MVTHEISSGQGSTPKCSDGRRNSALKRAAVEMKHRQVDVDYQAV